MSTTILQPNLNEFELYLEGIKIPTFKSIQISEAEEEVPAAAIDFVFNSEILKILPGTVVQVFCKRTYKKDTKTILLFEGEVTTLSFNFSSTIGRVISIKASSILLKMFKARLRPSNSIIKQEQWDAELLVSQKYKITTDNTSKEGNVLVSRQTDKYTSTGEITAGNTTTTVDNSYIADPKQDSNKKDSISGDFKNLKNEPDIQNFLQKISEELVPSNNRPGSKGNFNFLLQYFNNEFQKNDIIYGLNAIGFKIGPSLLAFPNPGKAKAYHLAIFQKAMNSYLQDLNANPLANQQDYNLIEVLQILKKNLHYKYLMPASPFFVKPLNTENFGKNKIPIRLLLIPDFESGPPIKCNVFFPEQVDNFNFQRDYINEATRLIASMSYANVKGMEKIPEYLNPIHVVPDVDITQEKDKSGKTTISSKLLFEETYRGVTLRASQYDASYLKALQDIESGKEKKSKSDSGVLKIQNSKEGDNSYINNSTKAEDQIGEVIRIHAMQDFAKLKYGQRMASFTTQWSPYRITGLPALVMFIDNLNVVGVIRSIQTSISPTGASSSITLKNVRLVYDTTKDFNKTVTTGAVDKSLSDKNKTFIENYIIEDNYLEGLMGANPIAFNSDLYSFENIGKTLYAYLTSGNVTTDTKNSAKEALQEYTGDTTSNEDSSMLLVSNTSFKDIIDYRGLEFTNYSYLEKSVTILKEFNKAKEKLDYQENYNKRDSILTKEDYIKYLNIDNLDLIEDEPCQYSKHLFKILSKEKISDASILYKLNENNGLKQLEKLLEFTIDYTKKNVDDEAVTYRIYHTNRMAHILNLKRNLV